MTSRRVQTSPLSLASSSPQDATTRVWRVRTRPNPVNNQQLTISLGSSASLFYAINATDSEITFAGQLLAFGFRALTVSRIALLSNLASSRSIDALGIPARPGPSLPLRPLVCTTKHARFNTLLRTCSSPDSFLALLSSSSLPVGPTVFLALRRPIPRCRHRTPIYTLAHPPFPSPVELHSCSLFLTTHILLKYTGHSRFTVDLSGPQCSVSPSFACSNLKIHFSPSRLASRDVQGVESSISPIFTSNSPVLLYQAQSKLGLSLHCLLDSGILTVLDLYHHSRSSRSW